MARKEGGEGWRVVRACARCGRPTTGCRCDAAAVTAGPGLFRLRLEKRRGKPVTVAAAEGVGVDDLKRLLKKLKVRLASGGTLRGGTLEMQGDHREAVRDLLAEAGFRVKGGGR